MMRPMGSLLITHPHPMAHALRALCTSLFFLLLCPLPASATPPALSWQPLYFLKKQQADREIEKARSQLAWCALTLGEAHESTTQAQVRLALLLLEQHQGAEAATLLHQAQAALARRHAAPGPDLALAQALAQLDGAGGGDPAQAEALLRGLAVQSPPVPGPAGEHAAAVHELWALSLWRSGQPAAAAAEEARVVEALSPSAGDAAPPSARAAA